MTFPVLSPMDNYHDQLSQAKMFVKNPPKGTAPTPKTKRPISWFLDTSEPNWNRARPDTKNAKQLTRKP